MSQNPYSFQSYLGGTGNPTGSNTYNYFNPRSTYGGSYLPGKFASTGVGDYYLEQNQEASFTRWLAENGYRDFTAPGEFARQQYGKVRTGYEAALGTNPDLKFRDYLNQTGPSLRNQYQRLTPEQRGENPSIYAPRARYIPR